MIRAQFRGRLGGFELDIDLEVPASGVTVLFGPSGAGKTTLLRCLAGLTRMPVFQSRWCPPHRQGRPRRG